MVGGGKYEGTKVAQTLLKTGASLLVSTDPTQIQVQWNTSPCEN